MAIDKAVDSAQLDAGLTTIANAIREKAGVSDNFTFPAGFAEAIAAIATGTDISPIESFETALITPAENMTNVKLKTWGVLRYKNTKAFYIIPHNLNNLSFDNTSVRVACSNMGAWGVRLCSTASGTNTSTPQLTTDGVIFSNAHLKAGITYLYIAIGLN